MLSSLCVVALLAGCDAMPTEAIGASPELTLIAVSAPSYAKGRAAGGGAASLAVISPSGAELAIGETVRLNALDAAGNVVAVKWSSSNSAVLAVLADGAATGVTAGAATVTAQLRNERLTVRLTVVRALDPPAGEPAVTPEPEPTPEPTPAPTPGLTPSNPIAICSDFPHLRSVPVSTGAELTDAIRGARPGDLITLADGSYTGRWTITTSGAAGDPVVLCGSTGAVLQDTRYDGGAVVRLAGADHWVLHGFTIRKALWGVKLEDANRNQISELTIHDIGQEAIGIRNLSSDNVVRGNRIFDTGRRGWDYQQWGEGIYIGSWSGHWLNGQVDRSDRNQLIENVIGPNVTAEHIDVKEGTTGTVIRGNTFDGRGMENKGDRVDSWVLVQGNDGVIENNRGTVAKTNGFRVWPGDGTWGQRNTFRNNTADVQAGGYGFVIQGKDNVVSCGNMVTNAASGFANTECVR